VPISSVIKGLSAAENLLSDLTPCIQEIFNDIDIEGVNIYLQKLESGSLTENFIIDIVFGGDEQYQKFRKKLQSFNAKLTGDNVDDEKEFMRQLIGIIFALGIGAGVTWALTSTDKPTSKAISSYNTSITNIVIGDSTTKGSLSGKDIQDIISKTVNKKSISKSAVTFISPAKTDPNANITIGDIDGLTIKPDVIKDTPENYTAPLPSEKADTYKNVSVFIVASDSRGRRKGWAGMVSGVTDKPLKIIISDELDPNKIHGKVNITADISIIKKYDDKKKQYIEKEIFIKAWS